MTRVTTTILILMVLMNGTVGIMESSGLSDDLGVELAPGIGDEIDSAVSKAQDGFSTGGIGSTLFGLFAAAGGFFNAFLKTVFAAPSMFMNLGFPEWFVVPIFVPLYIISMFEVVYAFTGRELA